MNSLPHSFVCTLCQLYNQAEIKGITVKFLDIGLKKTKRDTR